MVSNRASKQILNWGTEVGLVMAFTWVKGVSGLELGVFGDFISGAGLLAGLESLLDVLVLNVESTKPLMLFMDGPP